MNSLSKKWVVIVYWIIWQNTKTKRFSYFVTFWNYSTKYLKDWIILKSKDLYTETSNVCLLIGVQPHVYVSMTTYFLASNILVHQKCLCKNTLLCTCSWPAINKPLYVLGDMNLLCVDGESSFTSEMWQRIQDKPAGTRKMQPPEVPS